MRLIDADALIDELGISDEDIIFEGMLVDAPTIDAVPVVRCKDCKWWVPSCKGCKANPCVEARKPKDFCSYGERKDETI